MWATARMLSLMRVQVQSGAAERLDDVGFVESQLEAFADPIDRVESQRRRADTQRAGAREHQLFLEEVRM